MYSCLPPCISENGVEAKSQHRERGSLHSLGDKLLGLEPTSSEPKVLYHFSSRNIGLGSQKRGVTLFQVFSRPRTFKRIMDRHDLKPYVNEGQERKQLFQGVPR